MCRLKHYCSPYYFKLLKCCYHIQCESWLWCQFSCWEHQAICLFLSMSMTDSGQRYQYVMSLSSAQLECCCWWFRLLRKRTHWAAMCKQGQDPSDCPLLRSSIFPKLLDILLFFPQQQCYVPIISTNHNLLHSAVACMFALLALLWSESPSRRSLEVGKFLRVASRAVSWVCERTRFFCCRVMRAASKRTLLEIQCSLHSLLGEQESCLMLQDVLHSAAT